MLHATGSGPGVLLLTYGGTGASGIGNGCLRNSWTTFVARGGVPPWRESTAVVAFQTIVQLSILSPPRNAAEPSAPSDFPRLRHSPSPCCRCGFFLHSSTVTWREDGRGSRERCCR